MKPIFWTKQLLIASCVGLFCPFLFSCKTISTPSIQKAKQEIIQTEKAFADMAAQKGIPPAFLAFADEHAVLNRNEKLVKGKSEMIAYFAKQTTKVVSLTWTPDFVEVSASGDLGYTYGEYQITYLNKEGKEIADKGIFHTVWKRQPDGTWKFLWD